jgi:hypothetical protein
MKHIEDAHSDSIILNIALVNSTREPVRLAAQVASSQEKRPGRNSNGIVQMNHAMGKQSWL